MTEAVALCAARGVAVVRRGSFSYTGGYVPTEDDSIVVDMRGLDKVVEINATDMYVVVETGCTWRNLYESLKAEGLRTPCFVPMSGYSATVGGALSQDRSFSALRNTAPFPIRCWRWSRSTAKRRWSAPGSG